MSYWKSSLFSVLHNISTGAEQYVSTLLKPQPFGSSSEVRRLQSVVWTIKHAYSANFLFAAPESSFRWSQHFTTLI